MQRPNILIMSAAAKVLLVQAFREAAIPYEAKVYTADLAEQCATGFFADAHFPVRRTDAPGTMDGLLDLCARQAIGLIVPTRDGDLEVLSQHASIFAQAGTRILVAPPDMISKAIDKAAFSDAVEAIGLRALPRLGDMVAPSDFPVFVRPRIGAGGLGARRIEHPETLGRVFENEDLLVHPLIEAPEYSIDLLMSLNGRKALGAIARERLLVVAGESKITRVTMQLEAEAEACRIGEAMGLVGHNVIQFFDHPNLGRLYIEVNPRFGGASNLGIVAGLRSPQRILEMHFTGETSAVQPDEIARGLTLYRYQQDHMVAGHAGPV